jgi:putative photosynthetic complex assembly protein 2
MLDLLLPVGFTLLIWWASTGVILFLNHLPGSTYRWSMLGATALLLVALLGVTVTRYDTSPVGAILAFTQGIIVWAWLEMSYFMGFVTGPRKSPCPDGCSGLRRFWLAIGTSLYHELGVVAFGLLLFALTWQTPNPFAAWSFVVLWLMRWSAKLNLFLGVPNINDEWIPGHLRHLSSYIRRRSMNLLFPVSVSLATAVVALIGVAAFQAPDAFSRTGLVLVASLLALAVLEHWFLVLPVHDSALWAWAIDTRQSVKRRSGNRPGAKKAVATN